jgi:hypothetical protein
VIGLWPHHDGKEEGIVMAFKISNELLARRRALAADLSARGRALNVAVSTFNRDIAPLVQHVAEALDSYTGSPGRARDLADNIVTAAQEAFDTKSDKWQDSEKGEQVRHWIEQWEMSLDSVDLDLPPVFEKIDPEEPAGDLEDAPGSTSELEHKVLVE